MGAIRHIFFVGSSLGAHCTTSIKDIYVCVEQCSDSPTQVGSGTRVGGVT